MASSAVRIIRSIGRLAALSVAATALSGCPVQPSPCTSVLEFDTMTWCDAGVVTDPFTGATRATQVGGYAPAPLGGAATLAFGATESVNAHARGGMQWTMTEADADGVAEGFGVGTFDTGSGELTIDLSDNYGPFAVSRGAVTVTRFELSSDPDRPGQLEHFTATFEADTDHGHLSGAVRIR